MSPRSARRDRWTAAALAVLALAYLGLGRHYPLDTLATPGPGVFPFVAGLALLVLATWQLLAAGRSASAERAAGTTRGPAPRGGSSLARAPLAMSLVLTLYASILPIVGFLPASVSLVFLSARLMGLPGWWRPAVLAVGLTLACRVLFGSWLGVPLP